LSTFRLWTFSFALAIGLAAGTLSEAATTDPPAAPIPSQILNGKKVFISNASGESAVPAGTPELAYNEFYAAIKSWAQYEIVSAPADADLVLEIRFLTQVGTTRVMGGSGGSGQDFFFRLVVLDPKTQTVLWAFTRGVQQSGNQANGRKLFDQAMAAIVDDLKKLATPAVGAAEAAQK